MRRPGPQSESPQNGHEWDALLARCFSSRREELSGLLRTLLAGGSPTESVEADQDKVRRWFDSSVGRWQQLSEGLPSTSGARLSHGHYAVGYQIFGNIEKRSGSALLDVLRQGEVRHTGWPPFWVPTREGIKPYMHDGNVECWIGGEGEGRDPGHSDYWRATPNCQLFLLRGYQEDGWENERMAPGTAFDLTLPVWRIGEILLHAASLARQFGDPQARIVFEMEWTGLAGRQLVSFANTNRSLFGQRKARQDSCRTNISAQADQIDDALPDLVERAVLQLYELFDFFRLPATLVAEELARLRKSRF